MTSTARGTVAPPEGDSGVSPWFHHVLPPFNENETSSGDFSCKHEAPCWHICWKSVANMQHIGNESFASLCHPLPLKNSLAKFVDTIELRVSPASSLETTRYLFIYIFSSTFQEVGVSVPNAPF